MVVASQEARLDTSGWPDGLPCLVVDDITYIRASSLGRCMIETVGAMLGYAPMPPNQQTQRWWHEGRLHEPDIVNRLAQETGWRVKQPEDGGQWQVQVPIFGTAVMLVGHLDGLIDGEEVKETSSGIPNKPVTLEFPFEDAPVEAKSVGQWTWTEKVKKLGIQKWVESDLAYAYQFQTYLAGTGKDFGVYVVKNRNTGQCVWEVVKSPLNKQAPVWRVEAIMEWVEKGVLPPCDGGCSEFMSSWWHIHPRKAPARPRPAKDTHTRELVKTYKEILAKEKEQKKVKDDIKDELRPGLGEGKWLVDVGGDKPVTVTVEDKTIRRLSEQKLRDLVGDEAVDQCFEETVYPQSVTIR